MDKYEFKCWAEKAVSGIMFPPDREKVYRELVDHLEDHYDFLRENGMDDDAARKAAVDSMGDAYAIAPQLAAIHRPFWGYFLRATRVILVTALLVTIIPFGIYAWNTSYGISDWAIWDIWDAASYGGERELLLMSEPNVSAKSDGYTFTVTDAVWWYSTGSEHSCLMFYMKETHPLPWATHNEAAGWFWAEDSLGNTYECFNENGNLDDDPAVNVWGSPTSPFSYTYQMWINNDIPFDAEWVDIRCTRDGRNLVWRIDLTGGEGA